jgi:hypothetical protein
MRADKDDPMQVYVDFWDWLYQHPLWMVGVIFAYAYYLVSTEEI